MSYTKTGKIVASVMAVALASVSGFAMAADNKAAVIGDYATDGIKMRLEAAGYDVTLVAESADVLSTLGDFNQVWDLRYNTPLNGSDNSAYLSYLQDAGGLFLIGEHSGFVTRNNSLVSFITAAGGGDVSYAPNAIVTQYVTTTFNGAGVVVADSATPITVPSAGTVAAPGNGVFITTSEANGGGVGTGVAFGAGSLANAPTGRLLTYFDVDTFSSGTINNSAAVRALVDRMISFVAGDFQADPDLGGPGIIDTSKPEFTLADAAAQGADITFDGGTLTMTGGATPDNVLSAPVAIEAGGAFINTAGTTSTLAGDVSGDGGLIVQGQGTLLLTGTNSYTGGTVITDSSKLRISNAGALGTGMLSLMGGTLEADSNFAISANIQLGNGAANVIDTSGHDVALNGTISGAGGLIVEGGGNVVLSGANNHAGGVAIIGTSTVHVANGAALGTGALVLGGGTLATSGSFTANNDVQLLGGVRNIIDTAHNTVALNGTITGAGGLIVEGGGNLVLSGANNHAGGVAVIGDSTVQVADGGALGAGALVLGGGRLATSGSFTANNDVQLLGGASNVIDTAANTVVLSGAITGNGGLIKDGAGKLNITGDNSYSGDTQVNDGRLAMNGSAAASNFIVNAGGSIGGNGTVGGLIVRNGATAAPGNSIGQLKTATTVLFEKGSTYQVEVDASGASDRLIASGKATIEGGTVQVLAANGNYAPRTSYAIIVANGGVAGTFDKVTSDLAFLTPSLVYASNGVVLNMTRNDVRFADVGATFNQRATATAVDGGFSPDSALYNELVGMNAAEAQHAFDALSGEAHGSALSFAASDADKVRRTLLGRFDGPTGSGTEMWTTVTGSWNDIDGNGNSAAVDGKGQGFLTGIETDLAGLRVGVAGGYTDGDARIGARGTRMDVGNIHAAAYGGGAFGKLRVRAGVTYTAIDIRTDRQIDVGALSETLKAKYDGQAVQTFGEIGYAMPLGNGTVEPFAGVNALWLKNDAFTETGGTLALKGAKHTRDTVWSNLGFKASFALGTNSPVTAQVKGVWQHALTDQVTDSRLGFVNGGPSFVVHGAPLAADAALLDASLRWQATDRVQIGIGYAGTIANQGENHAAKLTLGVRF